MYIDEFCDTLGSDHTRRAYRKDLQRFASAMDEKLTSVDQGNVRSFIAALRERNEATSTIRRRLSAIRSFYDWMREEGHCQYNPARDVRLENITSASPSSALDRTTLRKLLSSVDGDTKLDVRARAIILTVLYAALRRGPLASLNVEDIRPLGRHWVIDLSSDDGRGGYIPIPSSAVEAIGTLKESFSIESGPLWRSLSNRSRGDRLSPDALYKIVRGVGQDANVESPVTIDRLRTSGMRLALAAGASPNDVRAHSRLQDVRSVAAHFDSDSAPAGLRHDVPSRIEEKLLELG